MEEKAWYVVRTASRAEKVVGERLLALGIENYVPVKRELRQWKTRRKWVEDVILKGFVLVRTTTKERGKVFDAVGVVRFLYFDKKLAVVTDREIEVLRVVCGMKSVVIGKKGFVSGDEVEIIDGPLIGMAGRLTTDESGGKICIYLPELGLFASINIEIRMVRKI